MRQVLLESRDDCSAAITGPGAQLSLRTAKSSLPQSAFNQLIVEINLIRIPVRIGLQQDSGLSLEAKEGMCRGSFGSRKSETGALGIWQSHGALGGSTTGFGFVQNLTGSEGIPCRQGFRSWNGGKRQIQQEVE